MMNAMMNKLSGTNKAAGLPVCLVVLALVAEMGCGDFDGEAPMMEMFIVAVAAPIALYLAKARTSSAVSKTAKGCVPTEDETLVRQATPWRRGVAAPKFCSRLQANAEARKPPASTTEKISLNARLDDLIKKGSLEEAEDVLSKSVPNADVISYNMVINACSKNGSVQNAQAWMQRMLDHGVQPDVASLNSVIDACARAGDANGAEHWLACLSSKGV